MKQSLWKHMTCLFVLLTLLSSTAAAASVEERRQELRDKTASTLEMLYQKEPSAKQAVKSSAGYAVFSSTGMKLGILGSSHGRGMAINNKDGREVFMKMKEYQAGLGLGIKEYSVIFLFMEENDWENFVRSGWDFGAQGTAAASDGVSGDAMQGAVYVKPGIWMYQMTTKGLSLELSLQGTEYYRDKDLSDADTKKN